MMTVPARKCASAHRVFPVRPMARPCLPLGEWDVDRSFFLFFLGKLLVVWQFNDRWILVRDTSPRSMPNIRPWSPVLPSPPGQTIRQLLIGESVLWEQAWLYSSQPDSNTYILHGCSEAQLIRCDCVDTQNGKDRICIAQHVSIQ